MLEGADVVCLDGGLGGSQAYGVVVNALDGTVEQAVLVSGLHTDCPML